MFLALQAYFEKAPKPVKEYIANFRESLVSFTVPAFGSLNDIQKDLLVQEYENKATLDLLESLKKGLI